MPVLTKEQYEKKKGKSFVETKDIPSVLAPELPVSGSDSKPVKKYEWFLLHPENGVNNLQDFQDVLKIDGKEYKRNCERGIVRTKDKPLADFLLKKGYLLMEKKECQ